MNTIALKLIGDVGWGLKLRVFLGAALSTLDLITDIYITYTYWLDVEKRAFFKLSVAMLTTSMFLALLATTFQNVKMGFITVMKQLLIVVAGLKPAHGAMQIARGAKRKEGQLLDPLMEMTFTKAIEMFAEAIPGVIIQLSAILSGGQVSTGAIVSLSISTLTTGFISAGISYDWDSDTMWREVAGDFYGYLPNSPRGRALSFLSLMIFSALMLVVRALILVLLGLISRKLALFYLLSDVGVYVLYKCLRSDFHYWLPLEGPQEVLVSLICRVMVKIIVDFTSMAQLRHPQEVGGCYWLFSFGLSLISLPMAVLYYELNGGDGSIAEVAWTGCYILPACIVLTMLVFFSTIKKEYRKTFWSTSTSRDFIVSYFDSDKDKVRGFVFISNPRYWKEIEDKVARWVSLNWERWMEEEPDWLDDSIKANIPIWMIPTKAGKEKIEKLQRGRRRSSVDRGGRQHRSSFLGAEKVAPKDEDDSTVTDRQSETEN